MNLKPTIYKRTVVAVAAALLLTTGCTKFLEQQPDSTWTALDTPQKVSKLLGTAYPQSSYIVMCESKSDNVADKGIGQSERPNSDTYLFQDVQSIEEDSPEAYWAAAYSAIAAANQALKACAEATDTALYSAQKGEALVARAYAHFMLVNLFSHIYDPATAASNPGIPYVTEPETVVHKQYERKTVAYVYDMIEKDLLAGLPLIQDEAYTVDRYHFNRLAANAFATRFYLFKKDYQKVLYYAAQAFPGDQLGMHMRPWNTKYNNMSPAQIRDLYANAAEDANLLIVETKSLAGRYMGRYRYDLSFAKEVEILGNNVTGGRWAYPVYYYGNQDYFVPKNTEYFVKNSVNATIGQPYVMNVLFTTEEVMFNRLEANAWLGNYSEVLKDLNLFASKRITNYSATTHAITMNRLLSAYGTTDQRIASLQTILSFKRAEYVQEGMRWFDMLRYGMTVTHTRINGADLVLRPGDDQCTFQLPQSVANSGLDLNPRK
ncbi:Starch-binding associating with outer membrane [Chitinophaga jiangningensis]|uniref:Starch-binding associating with outer membrane n=1 Tax=Chitinophaga jiangningensis TaxID=1419482 RepID=A0A1M7N3B9_9BACT|nr:RagB/SusD family nutrient uptake outer membrane protein [Chitinophaga jiangningensis]SHM97919.1 Starch-binding associating with outer membrane [Chitinophaga jiangningensis]